MKKQMDLQAPILFPLSGLMSDEVKGTYGLRSMNVSKLSI